MASNCELEKFQTRMESYKKQLGTIPEKEPIAKGLYQEIIDKLLKVKYLKDKEMIYNEEVIIQSNSKDNLRMFIGVNSFLASVSMEPVSYYETLEFPDDSDATDFSESEIPSVRFLDAYFSTLVSFDWDGISTENITYTMTLLFSVFSDELTEKQEEIKIKKLSIEDILIFSRNYKIFNIMVAFPTAEKVNLNDKKCIILYHYQKNFSLISLRIEKYLRFLNKVIEKF